MHRKGAQADARIATVATRQHGVVSLAQLRAAGLSESAVANRRRAGRLHPVHRGVYAVGHRGLSDEGRWMAAVLAFPGPAVLSHRSAAALWGLLPPANGPVDVSLPDRGGRRRRQGIRLHRCVSLSPEQMTRHFGIPVTTPARTIADLRPSVPPPMLRRAIRQAEVLGLPTGLDAVSEQTRSELEEEFLRLCRRHRLPMPEVNARVGSLTVDFVWRDRLLAVETDGYRYHRGRAAFEDDRARDLELQKLGFQVVRLSYRQVTDEREKIAAVLRGMLGLARKPPSR